jgi:hypothetical protein
MRYQGSCHCGRVAYEVEGEIGKVLACNCSMCRRKGSLLWFVPRAQMQLTKPEGNAAQYLFNKHVIKHRFCRVCGIHPYAIGTDAKGNETAAINVRCLEGIDLDSLQVDHYDGRSH